MTTLVIPSEVEESRRNTVCQFRGILRLRLYASLRMTSSKRSSLLHDLSVLDHGHAAALGELAFQGDRLAAVLS